MTGEALPVRRHLRLDSKLAWALAWLLAVSAPVVYLLSPGGLTWWLAPLLVVPLGLLAEERLDRRRGSQDGYGGGGDAGPWAPPVDHMGS
jgi:hypothetical protein